MSIDIRILKPGDLEAVLQLRYEALQDSPSAFMSTLEEAMRSGPERFTPSLDPENPNILLFGLLEDTRLVGITLLCREMRTKRRHIAWVESVYVKPDYRGRKLGKLLVQAAIEHARILMDGVDH